MKVFFKGSFYFSDNEICLIKALQEKNINVRYYIPIENPHLRGALFNIKKQYPHTGIYPASIYEEINQYKDYLDLSRVFVINSVHKSSLHPLNILLKIQILIEYIKFNPDILHYSDPLPRTLWFLYYLKGRNVLTLHDPFPHSGQEGGISEMLRRKSFKMTNRIVLLSNEHKVNFSNHYNFPIQNIVVSKLGMFDYLSDLPFEIPSIHSKYILFFGQVFKYKGIEYLLQAMTRLHESHPEIKLIVAGGGKYYFNINPYKGKDYIIIKNHYIDMLELVGLIRNCMFAVAPYTDATQSGLLINSFSLNVPVIASNVGHFPEMIKHEVTGLIVEPCNVDQLVVAMEKLVDSPTLLENMKRNIEKEWKPKMKWDKIADEFIEAYK